MTEGGRERSPEDVVLRLGQAGLELRRIIATPAPVSVGVAGAAA